MVGTAFTANLNYRYGITILECCPIIPLYIHHISWVLHCLLTSSFGVGLYGDWGSGHCQTHQRFLLLGLGECGVRNKDGYAAKCKTLHSGADVSQVGRRGLVAVKS